MKATNGMFLCVVVILGLCCFAGGCGDDEECYDVISFTDNGGNWDGEGSILDADPDKVCPQVKGYDCYCAEAWFFDEFPENRSCRIHAMSMLCDYEGEN